MAGKEEDPPTTGASSTLGERIRDQPTYAKVLEILVALTVIITLPTTLLFDKAAPVEITIAQPNLSQGVQPISPAPILAVATVPVAAPAATKTPTSPTSTGGTSPSGGGAPPSPAPTVAATTIPVAATAPTTPTGTPPSVTTAEVVTGPTCDSDPDCDLRACAYDTVNNGRKLICCPSGSDSFLLSPYSFSVCTGQPVGQSCANSDELCDSGVCAQGVCQAGPLDPGDECDTNTDCAGGTCVSNVCTASLVASSGLCDDNADCRNNACGRESLDNGSPFICCPSGFHTFIFSPYSANVCTGQAADQSCADYDELCDSGVCTGGICQESTLIAGESCDTNEDCSGTCVSNVCIASKVDSSGLCDDNDDCVNDTCGLASLEAGALPICCPSGTETYVGSPISSTVCTGQPTGNACADTDSLCFSSVCFQDVCQEGQFNEGGICDSNSDCFNGACGREALGNGSQRICCPSGFHTFIFSPYSANVCTGQAAGQSCADSDELCESDVCAQGVCQEGPLNEGEECDTNTDCGNTGTCVNSVCIGSRVDPSGSCDDDYDCLNDACGIASLDTGALPICCPSGSTTYVGRPISSSVCTGQATGQPCGTTDGLCDSGSCIGGVCQ